MKEVFVAEFATIDDGVSLYRQADYDNGGFDFGGSAVERVCYRFWTDSNRKRFVCTVNVHTTADCDNHDCYSLYYYGRKASALYDAIQRGTLCLESSGIF